MKKLGLVILLELFWVGALSAQNLQQLLAKRDFRTAVELIDGMLVKANSNERTSLVIQKARCLRNMRDLEGAISVLDNESLNNQSIELQSELADYHAAAGNLAQALELYEVLCKNSLENEYFLIQKALLENATKDYVGSLETCHRIFEKDTLIDILALTGHNFIHRAHLNVESQYADYDTAMYYYGEVLKRKPVHRNAVMQMMWLHNQLADQPAAIDVAGKYLKQRPEDAEINGNYAWLLFREKRFPEAHSAIHHQLADLRDSTADNFYLLGSCLYNLERYREAVDAFSTCRKLAPDDSFEILFSLGQSWGRGGAANRDSSLHYLNLAEQFLMPDTTKLYRCESEIAQIWFRGGTNYENAIRHYKKALELNPEYRDASFRIGYSYYRLGNYTEAIRWYERYLKQPVLPKGRREAVEAEIRFLRANEFMENPGNASQQPD